VSLFQGRLGGALLLAAVASAVIVLAVWLSSEGWPATLPPLAAGTAVVGVIFFMGVLMPTYQAPGPITLDAVRHAIAASFVVMFLVLLGLTAWFPGKEDQSQTGAQGTQSAASEPGATETAKGLADGFLDLLKIIIPFYFVVEGGAMGAVRFQEVKRDRAALELRVRWSNAV